MFIYLSINRSSNRLLLLLIFCFVIIVFFSLVLRSMMFLLLLIFISRIISIKTDVETLSFESGCLKESNQIQLRLRCSLYEHIKIIRIIYGYSKQRSFSQCQFSIYDCIQDGQSDYILSCNGKQTCIINLTKTEIIKTTVETEGVPKCRDFNYVQINYGCLPDANDICDSWKEHGQVIHISHTRSRDKKYAQCQCKIRSSSVDGQVLLNAREINRQFVEVRKHSNKDDCRKTTYLEIATDRSERKCMENLPSNGNALFGSGSHNFTLTYVRNDPFAELFFFLELKASPQRKDHHVQIVCNWARRTTTTKRTTLPMTRRRRSTTLASAERSSTTIIDDDQSTTIDSLTEYSHSNDNDEEWARVLSQTELDSSILDNQTIVSLVQSSIHSASNSRLSSKTKSIIIILLTVLTTSFLCLLYCFKVKQCGFLQRLRLNLNVAFLFCCEASKLLFSSPSKPSSESARSTPLSDYDRRSSEYYMNYPPRENSIYYEDKSIYSIYDNDQVMDSNYSTRYDYYHDGETC